MSRAEADDGFEWTITDHLLASAIDALHTANWQRGGNAANRPKPLPRPGSQPEEPSPQQLAAAKARMSYRFAREE